MAAHERKDGSTTTGAHLRRARRDPQALRWEELDERMRPWLEARVVKLELPPGVSTEDLVAETLASAWRNLAKFDPSPGASFRGWLLTIAERRCKDLWRRHRAQRRGSGEARKTLTESLMARLPDAAHGPTSVARSRELHERVERALESLPQKHRRVLELRLLRELPFAEIAPAMGYDKDVTVRSLYKRALERLRALLEAPE